jgi:histidinol-phosphate aminotransferase
MLSNRISITKHAMERQKRKQEIAEKYNFPLDQILDLSTGDNLFIPPSMIQKTLIKEIQAIDLRESYPIDYYSFIEEISRFVGVQTSCIYPGLTHGQLIQRLVSVITKAEDAVLLLNPDKGIYYQIAANNKLNIQTVDLTDNFELDFEALLLKIKEVKPSAIIFSSPHYPTANQFQEEGILTLAKEIETQIIIDESYVEFGKYTLSNQVQFFDNLSVVRSFSKAWGLGAVSCGYVVSNPELINVLKENFLIEEIPPIHLLATNYVLRTPYKFFELINNFITERERVIEHLRMLKGLKIYRSDTNFLFIKFKQDVKELYNQLCSKGIIIQTFEKSKQFKDREKHFLVTLGDASINDRFILAIIELLESIL